MTWDPQGFGLRRMAALALVTALATSVHPLAPIAPTVWAAPASVPTEDPPVQGTVRIHRADGTTEQLRGTIVHTYWAPFALPGPLKWEPHLVAGHRMLTHLARKVTETVRIFQQDGTILDLDGDESAAVAPFLEATTGGSLVIDDGETLGVRQGLLKSVNITLEEVLQALPVSYPTKLSGASADPAYVTQIRVVDAQGRFWERAWHPKRQVWVKKTGPSQSLLTPTASPVFRPGDRVAVSLDPTHQTGVFALVLASGPKGVVYILLESALEKAERDRLDPSVIPFEVQASRLTRLTPAGDWLASQPAPAALLRSLSPVLDEHKRLVHLPCEPGQQSGRAARLRRLSRHLGSLLERGRVRLRWSCPEWLYRMGEKLFAS